MKALTIKQPWAWLIMHGGKNIENREWPTGLRGRIAIHTSARMDKSDYDAAVLVASGIGGNFLPERDEADLVTGAIIGTVEIVDCVRRSSSPWFFGTWGFVLRDPVVLSQPIPMKGRLGFWDVPAEVLARLEAR